MQPTRLPINDDRSRPVGRVPQGPDQDGHGPARPWLACVVPLVVYSLAGSLEPVAAGGGLAAAVGIPPSAYPIAYIVRLAATAAVLATAWPAVRSWLGRPTWWPPLLGLALAVPWIVLADLQRQAGWGFSGRSAFDPFAHFVAQPALAWGFLAVRWLGLVVIVPIVEELFLRGFLMRFVIDEAFWRVPYGMLTPAAAAACAIYAAASHPAEAVAAVGWFAIVSGIALATRKPVDCILAHAGTNLAIGGYVLATGNWWLM